MYAGTTIGRGSGKIIGVHQKVDRAARRNIRKFLSKPNDFPTIKDILHFEGNNGPDGIMRKSPSTDEPWYYINPSDPDDNILLDIINDHIHNLTVAIKDKNHIRAAFESAWMAHAVVDGLTPAHHYPLSEKIEELWGKSHSERTTIKEKYIIPGDTHFDTLTKNWQYWGAGGAFTNHVKFEAGVVSTIAPVNFKETYLDDNDIVLLKLKGFDALFRKSVHDIDSLKMYEELCKKGWTNRLAKQTRSILIPEMIKIVALAWYQAVMNASES